MQSEPLKLLSHAINSKILVKLKNGQEYRGILKRCDNSMNLVLAEAEEVNNTGSITRYGKIFIRGSSILYIKIENKTIL